MPEFLKQALGSHSPLLAPLIRIGWMLFLAFVTLKLLDSALRRLRLLIPPGHSIGVARAEQRTETLRHIVRSVAKFALIVFVGLTISSELGFNIGPVLASVGIAGVAIGFGAQSLVKDVLSGFFILLEDQYGVGDVIKVNSYSGVVERMTLRATVLRNLEGQVHVIPNGTIQAVSVLTKDWSRAVVDVTVGLNEDVDHVVRVLESISGGLWEDLPEKMNERPTVLGIENLGRDGITIRCMVKTPPTKQWEVMREWRKRIKIAFEREGIDLSPPQRVMWSQEEQGTPASRGH